MLRGFVCYAHEQTSNSSRRKIYAERWLEEFGSALWPLVMIMSDKGKFAGSMENSLLFNFRGSALVAKNDTKKGEKA
jgi:hypothetical protein